MQYLENGKPVAPENSAASAAQYLQLAEGAVAGVAALLDSVECDMGSTPALAACSANLQSLHDNIKNVRETLRVSELGVSQEDGCLRIAGGSLCMLEEHCPEGQSVPHFAAHLIQNSLELRAHIQSTLEKGVAEKKTA
jgi:hypothetical protein